jgi:flagellar protein FlgJ
MRIADISNAYSYPLNPSQARRQIDRNSELYKACVDFESLFIKQMLDAMRSTLNKQDDMLGGGASQEIFEGMLYDEYAKKMAATAQFGLSDMIYRQVSSK